MLRCSSLVTGSPPPVLLRLGPPRFTGTPWEAQFSKNNLGGHPFGSPMVNCGDYHNYYPRVNVNQHRCEHPTEPGKWYTNGGQTKNTSSLCQFSPGHLWITCKFHDMCSFKQLSCPFLFGLANIELSYSEQPWSSWNGNPKTKPTTRESLKWTPSGKHTKKYKKLLNMVIYRYL